MFRRVGLLGSQVGNCNVCGHPYPPDKLFHFDGKLVCRYHRFRHTRDELDALWDIANKLAGRSLTIDSMQPINSDGTIAMLPDGSVPPLPPPPIISQPPGDGGGTTPPPGGGGGGTTPPPGDGGGGGGTGGVEVGTITTADYIDGSCSDT